jgi:hypothetical protein
VKILLLDIETSPNVAYTWGLFDQNVGLPQLEEPSRILCIGYKWLGQKRVSLLSEWKHGHDEMIKSIHALMSEADAVMTYNGKSFDIKHLNREFVEAGLAPPDPYEQNDLYLTVRSKFKFVSGKLDHVSVRLGLQGKVAHEGFGLWLKVMSGDKAAQRRMSDYCKRDVELLEELYERLKAWITNHPNARLYDGHDGCPTCGTIGRMQRRGYRMTKAGRYPRLQCQECGSWCQDSNRVDGTQIRQVAGT